MPGELVVGLHLPVMVSINQRYLACKERNEGQKTGKEAVAVQRENGMAVTYEVM